LVTPPGDYYNEQGEKIAPDGKNDKKVYVIKTAQSSIDFYGDVSYSGQVQGISEVTGQRTEQLLREGKFRGAHMRNVLYVGTRNMINEMVDHVSQDNGEGGSSSANNREYGGVITPNGRITSKTAGRVGDPSRPEANSITINLRVGDSEFHSHPSGTKKVLFSDGRTGTASWGGNTQAPSPGDFVGSTSSQNNFVFGMRSKTIFIYNKDGIKATMPLKKY